ncbi:MAG: hypothetical protein ACRBBN_12655 [Methyloligellaceae bacterium]
MTKCPYCNQSNCSTNCKSRKRKRIVTVASDQELSRKSHMRRLAIATKALGIPRREIPNWMADVIFNFSGDILWPSGEKFIVGDEDIDLSFNDEGSFRWFSDFMRFADVEPKQKPQERIIARLRLIDLSFRIAHPERAELIAK